MRTRFITLLSAVVLMLGILSVAQPAAAAPAQPFSVNECSPPGPVVYCYQAKGVIIFNVTPSGNATYIDNREECSQITRSGVVVQDVCNKRNYVVHARDGEEQVVHYRGVSEQTYVLSGTTYTCTGSYNAIYVSGEVRHDHYQFECNPPF